MTRQWFFFVPHKFVYPLFIIVLSIPRGRGLWVMLYININCAALAAEKTHSSLNCDLTFRTRVADIYDIVRSIITSITLDQKG